MKNYKGITIISLVVTIILICILAGITLPLVIGNNGILTYAKKAQKIYEEKAMEEKDILSEFETYIADAYHETEYDTSEDDIYVENDYKYHIDNVTKIKYVTYEDFDTKSNGIDDDYEGIKKAHDVANLNGYEVRATKSEYHIFKTDHVNPIVIKTNTDWNNAKFVIHDENIMDYETKDYQIFRIQGYEKNTIITDENILKSITLNKNTKRIAQLSGYGNCLCVVYNSNKKQFIRVGNNENSGQDQRDVFKIDNNGNILNDINWDFEQITQIKLFPIPDEQIVIKNANFETILPNENSSQDNGYISRNIVCYRSNTIIENIKHELNDDEIIAGPYYGFLQIAWAADVEIKDSKFVAHKFETASNYDLIIEHSCDVRLNNVTSDDIEAKDKWGITGTNYTKDITFEKCRLNRIDAHCGIHNLNIKDCELGIYGITVVGSGELNITDTNFSQRTSFIYLRDDYGATWDGSININNCEFEYLITPEPRIINFYIQDSNHNFGYDQYLPNISIDGLIINDSNLPQSAKDIYIFCNTKNNTGIENGDIRNVYNLPQNITLKNISTKSGRTLKLFYNEFYNSLDELKIKFIYE